VSLKGVTGTLPTLPLHILTAAAKIPDMCAHMALPISVRGMGYDICHAYTRNAVLPDADAIVNKQYDRQTAGTSCAR